MSVPSREQRLVEHCLDAGWRVVRLVVRAQGGDVVGERRVCEVPRRRLMLDVFLSTAVDNVSSAHVETESNVEGPFYVLDAPLLERPSVLPKRADEPGEALAFSGTVRSTDGSPLAGATLDVWQANGAGEPGLAEAADGYGWGTSSRPSSVTASAAGRFSRCSARRTAGPVSAEDVALLEAPTTPRPPLTRTRPGGRWVTFRAARIGVSEPAGQRDIAVTIELTDPLGARTAGDG